MLSLFLVSIKAAVLLSLFRFVWSETCQHALDSVLHWALGAAIKICLENAQSWILQREILDVAGMFNLQHKNHSSSDAIIAGAISDSSRAAKFSDESFLSSPLFTGVLCVMLRAAAPNPLRRLCLISNSWRLLYWRLLPCDDLQNGRSEASPGFGRWGSRLWCHCLR